METFVRFWKMHWGCKREIDARQKWRKFVFMWLAPRARRVEEALEQTGRVELWSLNLSDLVCFITLSNLFLKWSLVWKITTWTTKSREKGRTRRSSINGSICLSLLRQLDWKKNQPNLYELWWTKGQWPDCQTERINSWWINPFLKWKNLCYLHICALSGRSR